MKQDHKVPSNLSPTNIRNSMSDAYDLGHNVRANFDWANVYDVMKKVEEELGELQACLSSDKAEQVHELGDLLFTIVQVARHLNINPNDALALCNQRHAYRMQKMKELAVQNGEVYDNLKLEDLESYWSLAKVETKPIEKEKIKDYLNKIDNPKS